MATIYSASVDRDDVNTALASASSGDTVVIPAGTSNWSNGIDLTIPAGVILLGAGTSSDGGGDLTVVQDNYASGSPLFSLTLAATGFFRISGITFRSGTGSIKDAGTIRFNGPGFMRMDHCHLVATSAANYKMAYFGTGVFGVIDSCVIDLVGTRALYIYNGRVDFQGNYEWSQPTGFGSNEYLFIEDCIINGSDATTQTRVLDGNNGAKYVVRFNDLVNSCLNEQHATGHSNDDRGSRSMEIYCNAATSTIAGVEPNNVGVDMQGGTALVWKNSFNNTYKILYKFDVIRKNDSTYSQSVTPTGWGYAGTAFNGMGSNWDGGTFNGTSSVDGYPCVDQPGRGQGDLISGSFPSKVNSISGTIRWPNQTLEPIYIWGNVGAIVSGWGGNTIADQSGGRVVVNRDYYYDSVAGAQVSLTSPFNGTAGMGWGTLVNRPVTCTPGVAYFATDQGAWNTSESNAHGVQLNGASGVLYKCVTANVWELYYQPYTYPHPLRGVIPPTQDPPNQNPPPVITPPTGTYAVPQNVTILIAP